MISVSTYRYRGIFVEAAVFALLTLAALALLSVVTGAQTVRRPPPPPGPTAPPPEKVCGVPAEPTADGTIYKLVRYEHAGYFVVYSRSGGDAPPLVTVTMQKIIN